MTTKLDTTRPFPSHSSILKLHCACNFLLMKRLACYFIACCAYCGIQGAKEIEASHARALKLVGGSILPYQRFDIYLTFPVFKIWMFK